MRFEMRTMQIWKFWKVFGTVSKLNFKLNFETETSIFLNQLT